MYRVESFIEHQDACTASRSHAELHPQATTGPCLSRTASSPSPSSDNTNFTIEPQSQAKPQTLSNNANLQWPSLQLLTTPPFFHPQTPSPSPNLHHNRELLLLTSPPSDLHTSSLSPISPSEDDLTLSLGPSSASADPTLSAKRLREKGREQWRLAAAERAAAEEEFAKAKRLRMQAQAELSNAFAIRERAVARINSVMLQITCQACKNQFRAKHGVSVDESYMSSGVTTLGMDPSSTQNS